MEFESSTSPDEIFSKLTEFRAFGAVIRDAMKRDSMLEVAHQEFQLKKLIEWGNSVKSSKSCLFMCFLINLSAFRLFKSTEGYSDSATKNTKHSPRKRL